MNDQRKWTIRSKPLLKTEQNEGLRISLLGGFQLRQGDESFGPERFRLHKACSLVKLLALAPHCRLPRDQLLEWLWPDGEPQASTNSLHQALRSARQVLETLEPPCYIHLEDETLTLHSVLELWVDVEAFEAAAVQARQSKDASLFQAALNRAAVNAAEAVLVGDQYKNDILGAQGVGMKAMLIDRLDQLTNITDCPRLRTLTEVVNHLV